MKNLTADIQIAPQDGFRGFGPLGLEGELPTNADLVFTKFINTTIGLMTIIAIIWFIFNFIIGAIGIIKSGGDKEHLETARKKIQYSIYGIVVVVAATFIIKLIGFLIGIPDVLNFVSLFSVLTGNVVQ